LIRNLIGLFFKIPIKRVNIPILCQDSKMRSCLEAFVVANLELRQTKSVIHNYSVRLEQKKLRHVLLNFVSTEATSKKLVQIVLVPF